LSEVILRGLAPDKGLFLPDFWPKLTPKFLTQLKNLSFHTIAQTIAEKFITDIPSKDLNAIIKKVFNFPISLRQLYSNIYILELFHGPTMAFKDFGARFLSRIMGYYLKKQNQQLNIIVATSGDTGSAVASGFFKIPNIKVFILYPFGKVSPLQEKQLTTFGHNITALEVKGTFDDCQKLAKQILSDNDLNREMRFSSANSINFGRLLPQSFYYFWAVGQLQKLGNYRKPLIVVPSGNFGNLFAGLMAKKMGLPIHRFAAATNSNNIVPSYLKTGSFRPKVSRHTISNAMDVGNPSNFGRMLELYESNHLKMGKDVTGFSITDTETRKTIQDVHKKTGYILDPHTAVGVSAALKTKIKNYPIIVLATAHPAKFKEVVEPVIHRKLKLPKQLQTAMKKKKKSVFIRAHYKDLKEFLLNKKR